MSGPALIDQPGVYDIAEDHYHADPVPGGSLSNSGAKKLLPPSCPAKFAYEREHPPQPSAAMELGTAAHQIVLGAGPKVAIIDAENWRTNAAKDAAKEAREQGAVPLLIAEFDQVQAMAAAIRAHPLASVLFNPDAGGRPEQSMFWQDAEFGIWRRARLDWLPDWHGYGRLIVPDYKTCARADRASVAKAVYDYGYYRQGPWYCDGVRALGLAEDPAFVFVLQETTPPYLVTVGDLDPDAEDYGRAMNRLACEVYRDCTESGIWPGYGDSDDGQPRIARISLPPYAARQLEEILP